MTGKSATSERISWLDWIRFGPFLSQLVVIRKCNLSCSYCFEFDRTSEPVPYALLEERLAKLRQLRSWVVCLTGGEPTLHPEIDRLVGAMREMGFRRRQMITNGYRLTRESIESWNESGLTDLQLSIDGVKPNRTTVKVLDPLRPQLELLARHARFKVVLSAVIGSTTPEEAGEVIRYARERNFSPRVLLIHDVDGRIRLTPEELSAYRKVKRDLGGAGTESGDYREHLINEGAAPFHCRAGSRYLYVDEFGLVHWCSQTREAFAKNLMSYTPDDLRAQFDTGKSCNPGCSIGCARTASAYDEWRGQPARSPSS